MHGAPSVSYPVGRSRLEGVLVAVAALAGLAGLLAWARATAAPAAGVAAALLLAAAAAGLALQGWWRTPARRLAWDGEAWTLDGAPLAELHCIADLQSTLLLRCRGSAGARHWLWPARAADPVHWADLRRAVYSRARPDTPPDEPSRAAET